LIDDVRWLPEIAGDSDMPEADWNLVNRVSQQLVDFVEPECKVDQRGRPGTFEASSSRIEQLVDQLADLIRASAASSAESTKSFIAADTSPTATSRPPEETSNASK
jgi:hypothetical protein